jgi:hypothetical protein
VQYFLGETCAGSGDVVRLYFKKGRYRWINNNWKNILLLVSSVHMHPLHLHFRSFRRGTQAQEAKRLGQEFKFEAGIKTCGTYCIRRT